MSNLQKSFEEVRGALGRLDLAFAETVNSLTAEREAALQDLRNKHVSEVRQYVDELRAVKQEAAAAMDLKTKVDGLTAGVLNTERLTARQLFEKLAYRWENLSGAEIEMIEEVLDRKVIRL